MSPAQQHREAVFAREERESGRLGCFYAGLHRCGSGMGGRLTAEHPIPVQTLKENWRRAHSRLYPTNKLPEAIRLLRNVELDDLIADPDNGLIVCQKANLDLAAGMLRPPRDRLPQHVEEFAERFGLGWYLDDHYGKRPEAA